MRPDGGPLVRAPYGAGDPADDLHGLGILLLFLLTERSPHAGLVVAGEIGPAAEAATLLQGLLDPDPRGQAELGAPGGRTPDRDRLVRAGHDARTRHCRRAGAARRLATAVVLLLVAGVAGGYLSAIASGHRARAVADDRHGAHDSRGQPVSFTA